MTERDGAAERQRSITDYAGPMAGTEFDLDPVVEAAGIEGLLETEEAGYKPAAE